MIAFLKVVHIAAVCLWAGGILGLPLLGLQRARAAGPGGPVQLEAMMRFAYTVVVSPAAFGAIASGIALVFLRDVFMPWFSLKLALVGALVLVHTMVGLAIIRIPRRGRHYPPLRMTIFLALGLLLIGGILYLVLSKPHLQPLLLPDMLGEPGGLRRAVERLILR